MRPPSLRPANRRLVFPPGHRRRGIRRAIRLLRDQAIRHYHHDGQGQHRHDQQVHPAALPRLFRPGFAAFRLAFQPFCLCIVHGHRQRAVERAYGLAKAVGIQRHRAMGIEKATRGVGGPGVGVAGPHPELEGLGDGLWGDLDRDPIRVGKLRALVWPQGDHALWWRRNGGRHRGLRRLRGGRVARRAHEDGESGGEPGGHKGVHRDLPVRGS